MDFFQAQEEARRRTKWLVLYFALAVIGVILAVYVLVTFLSRFTADQPTEEMPWSWEVLGGTAAIVGGGILLGSLAKTLSLSGGGAVVARDLGGREIDPDTRDPDERRLLNVVEEMAIASGMPAPQVWVLDQEESINAFAAGTEPSNAVVAVSRGCLQKLTRSELQGVVAHEFSHILNGDMKLNMRLIGWLFGILMLSIVGRMILRSAFYVRSGRDRNGGGGVLAILAIGIGLLVIGGIGVFFGRLIQAAISRQREFLADAAAVQFTRDPSGISGALKKIGGSSLGGSIATPKASEASHMFFASAGLFSFGFSTHPPLDVRIRAIDRHWDGNFAAADTPEMAARRESMASLHEPYRERARRQEPPPLMAGLTAAGASEFQAGAAVHRSLPERWREATHTTEAKALVFGLLLAEDAELREREIQHLRERVDAATAERAAHWHRELAAADSAQKIALVEMTIPALRRLGPEEYRSFKEMNRWLIASDGQVDLFEFMLQKLVERHLDSAHGLRQPSSIRYRRIGELQAEASVLVSTMARLGGDEEKAFAAAAEEFRGHRGGSLELLPPERTTLEKIAAALETCDAATPLVKRQLLRLVAVAAASDGVLGDREIELLRAIADAIGCPLPLATVQALALEARN